MQCRVRFFTVPDKGSPFGPLGISFLLSAFQIFEYFLKSLPSPAACTFCCLPSLSAQTIGARIFSRDQAPAVLGAELSRDRGPERASVIPSPAFAPTLRATGSVSTFHPLRLLLPLAVLLLLPPLLVDPDNRRSNRDRNFPCDRASAVLGVEPSPGPRARTAPVIPSQAFSSATRTSTPVQTAPSPRLSLSPLTSARGLLGLLAPRDSPSLALPGHRPTPGPQQRWLSRAALLFTDLPSLSLNRRRNRETEETLNAPSQSCFTPTRTLAPARPGPPLFGSPALITTNNIGTRPTRPARPFPETYESSDDDDDGDDEYNVIKSRRAAIEMSLHAKREAYLSDVFKLKVNDISDAHHRLAFKSVAPTTFDQYCSTWNRLLDFGQRQCRTT